MQNTIKVAVIGHGYWGKNIARVLSQSADFDLAAICDQNPKAQSLVSKLYPAVKICNSYLELPSDIQLVAVVTPADSHFELAKHFLQNGKDVLLTKPVTRTLAQTEELLAIADRNGRTLFVDHTFVFNPAVRKLREFLPRVGQTYFILSQRLNLGLYQNDVNVIYDLMPHDLSIISYLFDRPILNARTSAFRAAGLPQEDLAHSSFELEGGIKGLITASWLSPFKIRQFFIVGSNGMLSYDDNDPTEKVKFFDKGISLETLNDPSSVAAYTSRISYRSGDLFSPAVPNTEALAFEVSEMKRAIFDPKVRAEYNRINLNVMKGLDALMKGLHSQGENE